MLKINKIILVLVFICIFPILSGCSAINTMKGYCIDFINENFKNAKFNLNEKARDIDIDEIISTNNCKNVLKKYDNLYIDCDGILSDDLDVSYFLTKDYIMSKTNKYVYYSDGYSDLIYEDGINILKTTQKELNEGFNTGIFYTDSEKIISKRVENDKIIIRTMSKDLKKLENIGIQAIDDYINDKSSKNLRVEKVYTFNINTKYLVSYDSFLRKDDKNSLHLQKTSGIFTNVEMPNFCRKLIRIIEADLASISNARLNAIVIKANKSDNLPAPYNQESFINTDKIASNSKIN